MLLWLALAWLLDPQASTSAVSKDGSLIASIGDGDGAMAKITISRSDGKTLREIRFRPKDANISGMRYVEHLEWMTNRRVVVSGSVNPSTAEYAVVDAESGKEVAWYAVDGYTWASSPDGLHAAYAGNVTHFTPEDQRHPQLCIDKDCGSNSGPHVEFTSMPIWSPGGTTVAIMAKKYDTKADVLIVRPLHGKATEFSLPPGADDAMNFAWDHETLIVHAGKRSWRLATGSSTFVAH